MYTRISRHAQLKGSTAYCHVLQYASLRLRPLTVSRSLCQRSSWVSDEDYEHVEQLPYSVQAEEHAQHHQERELLQE